MTRDLANSDSIYSALAEDNGLSTWLSVLIPVLAWTLMLISAWSIKMIVTTRPNLPDARVRESTVTEADSERDDPMPIDFAIWSVLLLILLPSLVGQNIAYLTVLFLWLIGLSYMWSLANYLNPELTTNHYWIIYLLGSSTGSTLLLVYHTAKAQPVWIELYLLLNFGVSAFLMLPIMVLSQQPDKYQQQPLHDEQDFQGLESDHLPHELPTELSPEHKQTGPSPNTDIEKTQQPSRPRTNPPKKKRKGGNRDQTAGIRKCRRVLRYLTT